VDRATYCPPFLPRRERAYLLHRPIWSNPARISVTLREAVRKKASGTGVGFPDGGLPMKLPLFGR
jgi:hypothetical protein